MTDLPTTSSTRLHQQSNKWHGYLPVSPHRLDHISGPTHAHNTTSKASRDRDCGWLVSLIHTWAHIHGYGNINPLSIDYACRPRLRSRLTLGGLTWPRNPWSSGGGVFHSSFATHACILTRVHSTTGHPAASQPNTTLPYPTSHKD